MYYSAASIANAFLSRAFQQGIDVSPMKIQKLVYIAHGYSLALRDQPLVDELFEAWRFGPVLPSLYHECKRYSGERICTYLHDCIFDKFSKFPAPFPPTTDAAVNRIIDFVWEQYGSVPATRLSDWTHEQGGPWDQVLQKNGGIVYRNQDINNDLIKAYFIKMTQPDATTREPAAHTA